MTQSPDRKAKILECSAELFATKGISVTTVREIGDAAGVFSGSLYHYFKSKNAIVAELLGVFMRDIETRFDLIEATSSTPDETVRGLIRETLTVIELHPHPTAIYQNDRNYLRDHGLLDPVDSASRGIREHWLSAIRRGVESGVFRSDIAPEIFYRTVRDTLWSTTHWPDRKQYSLEEFSELMTVLFFRGFCESPTV
ncbi:TetR/AcrR family transcriptional regulator [Tomitella biformata]|uniref:TetR/AcrR family transcriptional regulator n=1 Tax=Tomitella biformata TaxID=630403 RepID=UPI000462FAE8|nr:TetR/AcrR family transcriptional regulator [Tomitella biformata]